MADYGVKVSKPLFDATNAPDNSLLFSSAWPSLTIAVDKTFADGSSTYTHALGFVPLAMFWSTTGGVTTRYFPSFSTAVNSSTIQIPTNSATTVVNMKLYNLDIGTDVDYPYTANAGVASSTYDTNYGIKYAKSGRDINSTDLRNFIVHSRCQSPQVLAVKTQTSTTTDTVNYTSPNAYAAWVFGFIRKVTGDYYFAPYFQQSYPRTFITQVGDTYSYSLQYSGTDTGASLVVLRDPFFTSTYVQANY